MNSRRVLIGSLIGCGGLIVLGLLLVAAIGIGANIGMQKAQQQAPPADEGIEFDHFEQFLVTMRCKLG
jgi:hypothetical protein